MAEPVQNLQASVAPAPQVQSPPQKPIDPIARIPTSPPVPPRKGMRLSWLILLVIVVLAGALIYAVLSGKMNIDVGKLKQEEKIVPQKEMITEINPYGDIIDIDLEHSEMVLGLMGSEAEYRVDISDALVSDNYSSNSKSADDLELGKIVQVKGIVTASDNNFIKASEVVIIDQNSVVPSIEAGTGE